VELAVILFVMFPLLFAVIIGLSAVGGYLGGYLRTETGPPSRDRSYTERG
jgi:hypothetical protein